MIVAPAAMDEDTYDSAAETVLCTSPSENESGVTLTVAISCVLDFSEARGELLDEYVQKHCVEDGCALCESGG